MTRGKSKKTDETVSHVNAAASTPAVVDDVLRGPQLARAVLDAAKARRESTRASAPRQGGARTPRRRRGGEARQGTQLAAAGRGGCGVRCVGTRRRTGCRRTLPADQAGQRRADRRG